MTGEAFRTFNLGLLMLTCTLRRTAFSILSMLMVAVWIVLPSRADAAVQACDLAFLEDSSGGGQKRWRAFVFSDAITIEDRRDTAMAAAQIIIERTNYDFVDVFLTPPSMPKERDHLASMTSSAWARFAPDPSRIPFMTERWDIKVTSEPFTTADAMAFDHEAVEAIESLGNEDWGDCAETLQLP